MVKASFLLAFGLSALAWILAFWNNIYLRNYESRTYVNNHETGSSQSEHKIAIPSIVCESSEKPELSQSHSLPPLLTSRTLHESNDKEISRSFNNIYRNLKSLDVGSWPENTAAYLDMLTEFFQQHKIQSVLEIGCGRWMYTKKRPKWSLIKNYTCIDIVKSMSEENNKLRLRNFTEPQKFMFLHRSMSEIDTLPSADLVLIKDVFQHLPFSTIGVFLRKVGVQSANDTLPKYKKLRQRPKKVCQFRHILITDDVCDGYFPNLDIRPGEYACRSMEKPPFNLKVEIVHDFVRPYGKKTQWLKMTQYECTDFLTPKPQNY